ncbi:MAG: ABC transporter permease subunit [Candidatus Aenigmarchaeota archaeon]|nr:ABC transporter permease subunit [Candidatus Aenigmarchaeota archaeon]
MNNVKNPEVKFLPYYTFRTLLRITVTLVVSVVFGVSFGILVSMSKKASMIITPTFNIMQSIPILGYFPAVIILFISFFPGILGMELASVFLLFTSMVWAIFFGVVGAIKSIPLNIIDAAKAFNIKGFKFITNIIIPAIIPALISGSILAWCDGWFFMIAAESITYAGETHNLPGLGSFLAKSAYANDTNLAILILVLITAIVLFINHFTWHRLMEKVSSTGYMPLFRLGMFDLKNEKKVVRRNFKLHFKFRQKVLSESKYRGYSLKQKIIAVAIVVLIFLVVLYTIYKGMLDLRIIKKSLFVPEAANIPIFTFFTLSRLTIAYMISLGFAIFMGVLAAEHKKFATFFYPIYDIGQAIPILALFPILFVYLSKIFGGTLGLEITGIVMLVMDMIWYMFLNVVAAVKSIPEETREVSKIFGFKGIKRIRHIILPAILPALITGSLLSWGTGWNTIIFSEYMPQQGGDLHVNGLGYLLSIEGYKKGNTIMLVFILFIISTIIILMEKFIWDKLLSKTKKYELEA